MPTTTTLATLKAFMEAIYPGNAELALASFSESKVLTDATETINELRAQLADANQMLALANQVCREINATEGHGSPVVYSTAKHAQVTESYRVIPLAPAKEPRS